MLQNNTESKVLFLFCLFTDLLPKKSLLNSAGSQIRKVVSQPPY